MDRFLRMLSIVAMTVVLAGFSVACNTTEGVGRDIEAAGDGIKDAAD